MKSITLDLPYKVEPAKDGNRRNSRDLTSKKGDLMGPSCFVIVGADTSNNIQELWFMAFNRCSSLDFPRFRMLYILHII